jgi:hypothetical protein
MIDLSQRNYAYQLRRRTGPFHRISQRAAKSFKRYLHHVTILQTNAIAKTQTRGPEKMHVYVTRATMSLKLKMMVLDILQAVAHPGFSGLKGS